MIYYLPVKSLILIKLIFFYLTKLYALFEPYINLYYIKSKSYSDSDDISNKIGNIIL